MMTFVWAVLLGLIVWSLTGSGWLGAISVVVIGLTLDKLDISWLKK